MIYQNFSKRQLLTLTWWNKPQFMDCDGIICDGSIRSGKTVSMTDGFILWSMSRFNGQNFAICGKTIESLRRNVITLMPQWLEGIFSITERRSENKLIITSGGVTNSYYMFGGKDESSYCCMVVRSKTQTSKVRRPDMERCELYKPGDWKTRWETELHEGGKQE